MLHECKTKYIHAHNVFPILPFWDINNTANEADIKIVLGDAEAKRP